MKTFTTFSKIILNIFFLMTMSLSHGQVGSIQGKVTDEKSKEAMIGACISYSNDTVYKTVISDMNGSYKIVADPGVYKIKVQYIGYKLTEITGIVLKKDSTTIVDIALQSSGVALKSVIVSDSKISDAEYNESDVMTVSSEMKSVPVGGTYTWTPKSKGSRSSEGTTYVDGVRERSISKKAYYSSDASIKSDKIATHNSPQGGAGILTAGELNDFAKWNLWNDISSTDLKTWQDYWQFKPIDRYSLQIVNSAGKPLIDAKVQLQSKTGKLLWESKTDNTGKTELWADIYEKAKDKKDLSINVFYDDKTYNSDNITAFQQGINVITLPVSCNVPKNIDIMFMVDATGSMSDEIKYLKAELLDLITSVKEKYSQNTIKLGCVFYRDLGDEYVTKKFDLTENIDTVISFINDQYADGGGDEPEAVDSALSVAVNKIKWDDDALARMMFLVLDAPPHYSNQIIKSLQKNIQEACAKGIRLVPVIGSGISKSGEYLFRSFALATNGTYIFLTDHSGVGDTHLKPTTDEYDVTLLKDLLRKTIDNFVFVAPCDAPIKTSGIKDTMVITNPKIIAHVVIDQNKITKCQLPTLSPDTNKIVFLIDTAKQDTGITKSIDTTNHDRSNIPGDFKSFKYYPNPTTGQLYIEIQGDAKEIYLADINGKLLEKYEIKEQKFDINISKYAAGLYFLEYSCNDKWLTGKVVLQK